MAELAIVAAGLQIAGGLQAESAARQQAKNAARDAEDKAQDRIRDTKRARSRQLVGFLKSGVQLDGTPMDILAETEEIGARDVNAIRRTGAAQAADFKAIGRAKLLSSLGNAAASGADYGKAKGFY